MGSKMSRGKKDSESHIVCDDLGGSAREQFGASSEHSGVGLREMDEACAGGEAG